MKKIILLSSLILIPCFVIAQQYVWTKKPSPPILTGIYEPASFSIGNYVYFAGGADSNLVNTFNELWEYNTNTEVWTQKANMPGNGAYGCRAFVINNDAYVYTGWWRNGTNIIAVNINFVYQVATNSWSTRAMFPDANRYTGVAFAINGKGYYGTGYSPFTNDLWEYDPVSDTWTQRASLPGSPRQAAVGCAINGLGYVGFGGKMGAIYHDWWAYNPVLNIWNQKATFFGLSRMVPGYFVIDDNFYMVGGSNYNSMPFQGVHRYNATTDTWNKIGTFPGGRRFGMAMGQANGRGYAGQGSMTAQNTGLYATVNDWWEFSINETSSITEYTESWKINYYAGILSTAPFGNIVAFDYTIHNLTGSKVLEGKHADAAKVIDVSRLSPGVYVFRLTSEGGALSKKFMHTSAKF